MSECSTKPEGSCLPQSSSGLRIGTFNSRTLSDRFLLHSVCGDMERLGIDVMCVQESRTSCAYVLTDGWHAEFSSATSDGNWGVAIIFSPKVSHLVSETRTIVPHRCIVSLIGDRVCVVCLYAPTSCNLHEREMFFSTVRDLGSGCTSCRRPAIRNHFCKQEREQKLDK